MRADASLPKAKVKGLWLVNDILKHILAKTKRLQILLLVNKHRHIFHFLFLFHEVELFDYICVLPHTYFFFFFVGGLWFRLL